MVLISPDLLEGSVAPDAPGKLREGLSGQGLAVETARSRRDGQVEGVVFFDSVAALCDAPLFRRECSYERTPDGGFNFAMTIGPRPGARPRPEERAEIRVRTEARITAHNSDGPLQRGNVLVWRRSVDGLLGEGLEIQVRTDGTSVFAATTRIVLRSALIAFGIVGIGLALLVLEGRRRLRPGRDRPANRPANRPATG